MRPPVEAVILPCGHVEIRPGHCATTDCENFVDTGTIKGEALSVLAIAGLLLYVRLATGRGMLEIISASLPSLGLE